MRENTLYVTIFILIILAATLLISLTVRIVAGIFSKHKKPMRGFFITAIAFCLCGVLTVLTRLFQFAEVLTSGGDSAVPLYRNLFVWLLPLTIFLLIWSIWLFIAGRRKHRGEEPGKSAKVVSVLLPGLILVGLLIPVTFHGVRLGSDIAANQRQYNTYLEYVAALDEGDYDTAAALFHQEMDAPTKHNGNYHYHAQQHLLQKERQYRDGEITHPVFEATMQGIMKLGGDRAREAADVLESCARYIELDKALEQGDASLRDGDYQAAARIYYNVQQTFNFHDNDALAVRIDSATEKLDEADNQVTAHAASLAAEMKHEEASDLLLSYHCATFGIDYAQFIEMSDTVYEQFKEINVRWAQALAEDQEYGQAIRVLLKTENDDESSFVDEDLTEQLFSCKELYYPVMAAKSKALEDAGQPRAALDLLLAEADCFNYASYGGYPYSERDEALNSRYRGMVGTVMERCGLVWLCDLPLADKRDNEGAEISDGWSNDLNEIHLDGYYGGFVEYRVNGAYSFIEGEYQKSRHYHNGVLSEVFERKPVFFLDGVQVDDAYYVDGKFHIPIDGVSILRIGAEYFSTGIAWSDVVTLSNVTLG